MKAVFAAFKRSPKLAAFAAATLGAILIPAALLAWGPDRPTFTMAVPSDHVTFNSITDNPNIGDERDFVGIREAGTQNAWTDNMAVQPGKSYTVRMYVHNNAASNLNLVAQNVTAEFSLPSDTGTSLTVGGFLRSSNASPTEVYDDATFNSAQPFNLDYQTGSLKYENNAFGAAGTPISESVFSSTGALLGFDKLDGKIPGCLHYAGYLTFTVTPQFGGTSNFDMSKQVRKDGDTNWSKSVNVNLGDTVNYLISYKNTGDDIADNVLFRDQLPAGMTYVPGTTVLRNGTNPVGLTLNDDLTTGTGVNVGDYEPAATAYVKFSAKVTDTTLNCGTKTYTNTAHITVDNAYKEDTADVNVSVPCQPGQTPAPVLPHTGASDGIAAFVGLGIATAGAAYAATSSRARNLLRR